MLFASGVLTRYICKTRRHEDFDGAAAFLRRFVWPLLGIVKDAIRVLHISSIPFTQKEGERWCCSVLVAFLPMSFQALVFVYVLDIVR